MVVFIITLLEITVNKNGHMLKNMCPDFLISVTAVAVLIKIIKGVDISCGFILL